MLDLNSQFLEMKAIADLAPCGIGLFDLQTSEPVFFNQAYYLQTGYTEEEFKSYINDLESLLIPEDRHIAGHGKTVLRETGNIDGNEYRILRKDGSVCWVKLTASVIAIENRQYAFTTFTDITEEKEASSRLSLVAENVGTSLSLIRMTNGNEELIYGNEAFYCNVGIAKEQYHANMPILNKALLSDEDYTRIRQAITDAMVTGKPGEITHKLTRPDGKILWLTRRFAALRQGESDSFLLVSAVNDVTDIKEKELETAIEKQRFQTVIEELNAAVFEWDLITGEFYCSEAYKEYEFSRVKQEDILNNRGSLDVVHPEDVSILMHFFSETTSGKDKVEATLRLKMIDGAYRWCRMMGFYYKDKNGKHTRTVGVVIDVNEEHERSFMLNSILNELPGGVAILYYTEVMKCQYFNDRFATLNGRTREEVEKIINDGTFMEVVVAPVDYERVMQTVKACVFTGKPINITYRFLHKDSSIHWIHLYASKIRDENSYPVYYCVFTTPSEEAELYREVVEDSPVGVVAVDKKEKTVLYINDTAKAIHCFSEDEAILGHSMFDAIREHNGSPVLTDDDIHALSYDQYTVFHGTQNGKYLALRARAITWNSIDAYIVYVTDETKEHEEQLRLQKLIDGVPTGIGIYDIDGDNISLTYLNDAYYREIGAKREERQIYMGNNTINAVFPRDRNKIMEMVSRLVGGEDLDSVVIRLLNVKGEWIWFKLSCSVVERNGTYIRLYATFTNCNDMVLAQRKLEENKRKEQIMLASIPGGAVVYRIKNDKSVFMEYVSDGFAKLMGYRDSAELKDDVHGDAVSRIPPADAEALMEHVLSALKKHEPISFIYNVYTKTGSTVKIRMDANAMPENQMESDDIALLYAVHTPVSKESQLALEEQKRYRALMNTLDIALLEWSSDEGLFTSEKYNDYAISREAFDSVMRNPADYDVVYPEDLPVLAQYFTDCLSKSERVNCIVRMKMRDGSYRWTEMRGFIECNPDNKLKRATGVLRDIDKERIEQNERLKTALSEAEKANEAKSAFLSRVSHDMRTPLNGILGLTGIIKESVKDSSVIGDLAQIELSGQYLMNLINDTLDVSRIESGKMELHPTVCDGRAIFESVIALSKPMIDSRHIHAQYLTDGLTYPLLYIDIGRVQQIMMNILGNAAKFTPEGGHITCTMRNLSIDNGMITDEVCIEDDGIGMSEEYLPHIFDAFSQADSSKKNSREGTGLGMIITKQLVELMGGTISVESQLGKGTKVTFTLIMPIATPSQIEAGMTKASVYDDSILKGKRVLLCEDHPVNAKITIRLLEKKGVEVVLAENGKIGCDIFADSPTGFFDAILMDIRMPEMDGLETSVAIRGLNRRDAETVPIIAITANALKDDIDDARRAGMDAHLSKPIDSQKLFDTLCEFLYNGRR